MYKMDQNEATAIVLLHIIKSKKEKTIAWRLVSSLIGSHKVSELPLFIQTMILYTSKYKI